MVTPESSLPVLPVQIPRDDWLAYEKPFNKPGQSALVGVFTGDDEHGYTNSLVGLDTTHHMTNGTFYRYGKRHLLPFGEYVPPGFHWFVDMMKSRSATRPAASTPRSFAVGGQRVRPLICYEDLFGEDFAPAMVGPNAATLLANATNLAWFGKRMIQDQHLQFSANALARVPARPGARHQHRRHRGDRLAGPRHRAPAARGGGRARRQVEGRIGDTPYAAGWPSCGCGRCGAWRWRRSCSRADAAAPLSTGFLWHACGIRTARPPPARRPWPGHASPAAPRPYSPRGVPAGAPRAEVLRVMARPRPPTRWPMATNASSTTACRRQAHVHDRPGRRRPHGALGERARREPLRGDRPGWMRPRCCA